MKPRSLKELEPYLRSITEKVESVSVPEEARFTRHFEYIEEILNLEDASIQWKLGVIAGVAERVSKLTRTEHDSSLFSYISSQARSGLDLIPQICNHNLNLVNTYGYYAFLAEVLR